ncbi:unnamed protein product [Rotaria sp. Silwood1]|nr:unnamed protein product [Rotaria sp. Silwood1]
MRFDDNYYGRWEIHSECKCTFDKKVVVHIRWIEVPMIDGATEGWLNFGRTIIRLVTAGISELMTGSNGNLTHEAIECQYHCSECGCTGYYTFDYSNTEHINTKAIALPLNLERGIFTKLKIFGQRRGQMTMNILTVFCIITVKGFTKCVILDFTGYIIIAIFVMSFKNKILLIIVFGTVGTLDTLTESPLYGIAGFLNVSVHTIIRLIILLFHSKIDLDQLSFYIFMSVLIILSGLAIYVYYRLIYIPSVNIRMNQQMASFKRENPGNSVELYLVENELSFWELSKILKIHLFNSMFYL